jgi:hypothetical protein
MTTKRLIYNNDDGVKTYSKYYGEDVSLATWIRARRLLREVGLDISELNVALLAEVRKITHELDGKALVAFIENRKKLNKIFPTGKGNGLDLKNAMELITDSSVSHSSYSRWFIPLDGFKRDRIYSVADVEHMLINLYYAKVKKEDLQKEELQKI